MDAFVRARAMFWGSHSLGNHPQCNRDCGHLWTVEVEVTGDENPDLHLMPVDEVKFKKDLLDFCDELIGKDIDTMIRPSVSSPMGLAHWFYERMANKYKVTEVRVWIDPDLGAMIRSS